MQTQYSSQFAVITATCVALSVLFLAIVQHVAARPALPTTLQQAAVSFNPSAITVTRGGAAVTANLTVQNTGTTTETFTLALSSMPGLVVTSSSNQLNNVAPGASAQVIVTITAGANATLGTQQLLATITQTSDSSTFTGALAITVNDPPTPSLRIELRSGERVRDAAQGSVTTYQLRVVNAGSVRTTFNLAFDPSVRCSVDTVGCTQSFSGQTQGVTLDPNAGFDFDVSIRLPTDARVGNTSITRVVAQVGANDVAALLLELRITAAPTPTPVLPLSDVRLEVRRGAQELIATPNTPLRYQLQLVNVGPADAVANLFFDPEQRCSVALAGCSEAFSGQIANITVAGGSAFLFDVIVTPPPTVCSTTVDTRLFAVINGQDISALTLRTQITTQNRCVSRWLPLISNP